MNEDKGHRDIQEKMTRKESAWKTWKRASLFLFSIFFLTNSLHILDATEYTNNLRQPIYLKFDEPGVSLEYHFLVYQSGALYDLVVEELTPLEPYTTFLRLTPTQDYLEGYYEFTAQAVDQNNNFMEDEIFFDFYLDTTFPQLLSVSPSEGEVLEESAVSFELVFNEPSILKRIEVVNEFTGERENITSRFSTLDNITFRAQKTLDDSRKQLYIVATDLAGNQITDSSDFAVNAYPVRISLTSPQFGWSNTTIFDVVVTTDELAECLYYIGDGDPLFPFNVTGTTEHILYGIYLPTIGDIYSLQVGCTDTYEEYAVETFQLQVDITAPIIQDLSAVPDEILSYPLNSIITAVTDEPVVCRYDENSTIYASMQGEFENFDEDSLLSYSIMSTLNLTGLADDTTYNYNVACKNRAGLISSTESVQIRTESSRVAEIHLNYPAQDSYISVTSGELNITTNKNAVCQYSTSFSEPFIATGTFGPPEKRGHVSIVEGFDRGNNQYIMLCTFSGAAPVVVNRTLHFTVDTTPPTKPIVNDSSKGPDPDISTYSDRIFAKWTSTDNESGIDGYNVSVYSRGNYGDELIVKNWTFYSDSSAYIRNLELENNTIYYVRVKARNRAGLWSETGVSNGVEVEMADYPDTCTNDELDGDETDTDCGGSCPGCPDGDDCVYNSDCDSDYCDEGVCKDSPFSSCSNDRKDNNETDIDCGGSLCSSCNLGQSCKQNRDCETGFCDITNMVCDFPDAMCFNGFLDQDETDVDCGGGICLTRCDFGMTCLVDTDCESNNCAQGLCGEEGDDEDRDDDDILNIDDNCPDVYNPDQSDSDADGIGDGCDDDRDGDGMPNEWEMANGLDPDKYDSDLDMDEDGLTNLQEYNDVRMQFGTSSDPQLPDTDGDGYSDGEEMEKGTDPTDPLDHPKTSLAWLWMLLIIILCAVAYLAYGRYQKGLKKKKDLVFQSSGQSGTRGGTGRSDGSQQQKSSFAFIRNKPQSEADKKKMEELKQRQEWLAEKLQSKKMKKHEHRSDVFSSFDKESRKTKGPISVGKRQDKEEISSKDIEKLEKLRKSVESKIKQAKGISKDAYKRSKLHEIDEHKDEEPQGRYKFMSIKDIKKGVGGLLSIKKEEKSQEDIIKDKVSKRLVEKGIFDQLTDITQVPIRKKRSEINSEDIFAQIASLKKRQVSLKKLPDEHIFDSLLRMTAKKDKVTKKHIKTSLDTLVKANKLDKLPDKTIFEKLNDLPKKDRLLDKSTDDEDLEMIRSIIGKKGTKKRTKRR